jgi:hypothetical protein
MTGRILLMAALVLCAMTPALAQTSAAPGAAAVMAEARPSRVSPRTYYAMRQRRDQLDREVATAEDAFRSAEYRITQFKTIEENEERARADLKDAEEKKDVARVDSIRAYLATLPGLKRQRSTDMPALEKDVPALKSALDAKVKEREELDQELARIIDLEAPRQVFSGRAGLQFITLFSLVIAIILFGIVEILEGKELAALLGGLSGYILGRSTSSPSPTSTQQQNVLNPAPAPNVPAAPLPAPAPS